MPRRDRDHRIRVEALQLRRQRRRRSPPHRPSAAAAAPARCGWPTPRDGGPGADAADRGDHLTSRARASAPVSRRDGTSIASITSVSRSRHARGRSIRWARAPLAQPQVVASRARAAASCRTSSRVSGLCPTLAKASTRPGGVADLQHRLAVRPRRTDGQGQRQVPTPSTSRSGSSMLGGDGGPLHRHAAGRRSRPGSPVATARPRPSRATRVRSRRPVSWRRATAADARALPPVSEQPRVARRGQGQPGRPGQAPTVAATTTRSGSGYIAPSSCTAAAPRSGCDEAGHRRHPGARSAAAGCATADRWTRRRRPAAS